MRYFTPELLARFRSDDDAVADLADQEWEAAILAYREHLDGLRGRLPAAVELLAGLCLHDAELLSYERRAETIFAPHAAEAPPLRSGVAILSARQDDEVYSLIYVLGDQVEGHDPSDPASSSNARIQWLYDEVDVLPDRPGRFVHRILWDDGSIQVIPFTSILIHSFRLDHRRENASSRQIA